MDTQATPEVAPESTQEATTPTAPTLEQLQARLTELQAENENLKSTVKGKDKAVGTFKAKAEAIDSVKAEIAEVKAMVRSLAKAGILDEDSQKNWEANVEAAKPKPNPLDVGYGAALDVLFADEEVTIEDLPEEELAKARSLWQEGKFDASAKAVKKSLTNYKKSKADSAAQAKKEAEDRERAERDSKANKMVSDRKGSQGASKTRWTMADIENMSTKEYSEHEQEIKAAMWRGEIK